MQLVSLSALSVLIVSTCAADCWGTSNKGVSDFAAAFWDAREKMCGNKDCGYQQDCTTYSSKTIKGLAAVTVNVSINRKKLGAKGFKDCWGATENIINQCIYNEQKLGGVWAYDGQVYQVNAWYSY